MNYETIIKNVINLDFVPDEKTADAMIKSVLGHFASRMKETQAKQFTKDLPEPLNYNKLRGHQINITEISLDQFANNIQDEFNITNDQVQTLVRTIFHLVKSDTPIENIVVWEQGLPSEWAAVVKNA